jgi:hypothetical protein
LSGCSSFINTDVSEYPLVSSLTTQEVVDYYAKALDYDSVVSRNVTVHETSYVTQDIKGSKEDKLKSLVNKAESILAADEYEFSEENARVVSEDTYNYIKATIDDIALSNGSITSMTGALGYYFVDVDYTISAQESGEFTQMANILGLNGVWTSTADGSYKLNETYLNTVVNSMNQYYYDNNIVKCAVFDSETGVFDILDGVEPVLTRTVVSSTSNDDEEISNEVYIPEEDEELLDEETDETLESDDESLEDEDADTTELDNEDADSTEETSKKTTNKVVNTTEEVTDTEETNELLEELDITPMEYKTSTYTSMVDESRRNSLDIRLINAVAGSSLTQKAFLPSLDIVYTKPASSGDISGYGIYSSGSAGLKLFGYDRSNMSGTLTMRYVFKDDPAASGDIIGTNIYVVEEDVTTGTNISDQNVIIPEFLESEFEQLIERADRVQVNADLAGILNGLIYEDLGVGVLTGYKNESSNVLKYMSTIRQIISRNTENNAYELEIETTTIEGPKSVDCYGTYRDKYYVVIQQQGTNFVISDMVRVSREMASEPPINPDSAVEKRLVALNLAGEVSDDAKSEIIELMSDLYTAGTNRLLYAKDDDGNLKTINVNGTDVTLERGMYDCFDSDTTMLSSDELEYLNSQIRNQLVKYGTDTPSVYSGTVTKWIGGYDNQAEFTTEELITYSGQNTGYYAQVYYLVSKMNDIWVIDERTIMDEREVTGTDLENIKSRVGQ